MRSVLRALSAALVVAVLAGPVPARAASKALVAALGDPVPGGGLFAGPGFTGWPAAAGDGWIAFRGQTQFSNTNEQLLAWRYQPRTEVLIASIGQPAPGGGTFKQFLGRPAVNASGDVAFVALIAPPPVPAGTVIDPTAPVPAGIFLSRGGTLSAVALSGQATADGVLDLVANLDGASDDGTVEVSERGPALNGAGDVAFLAGLAGGPSPGAIFVVPAGGAPVARIRIGDAFDDGEVLSLGPPALDAGGRVVFHATATTSSPMDDDGLLDGILFATASEVGVVIRDGARVMPLDQVVTHFEDPVAVDDAGDVALLAGPLFDPADDAITNDEGIPGVVVCTGGVAHLAGYPGQEIGADRVTDVTLGPRGGNELPPPALAGDGSAVFFVELNGGSAEAFVRWSGGDDVEPIVYTAGPNAGDTPAGGIYAGASSAPAVDANGALVFFARITNGSTSEAVVYRPAAGGDAGIVIGDAAPNVGFFAGPPFSSPLVNEQGDVVFHAFIARGPASAGIFRFRGGRIETLVRTGDPAPIDGSPPFLEFVGLPSLAADGAVAFAAQVAGKGRGIYLVDASGRVQAVAVRDDPAPGPPGTTFRSLGPNPDINAAGAVAFRGNTSYKDPNTKKNVKEQGIFVADATGIQVLAYQGETSPDPAGLPFFKLQDPVLTSASDVVFRAPLGVDDTVTSGLFFAGPAGMAPIALEQQELGGGVILSGFTGKPSVGPGTDLAFLASRTRPLEPGSALVRQLGPAILRRTAAGLDLVTARDMPGPIGGNFRSLGVPSMSSSGHIAFRGSFQPLTGGIPGIYLATTADIVPYALVGENTPLGGQFTSFGARTAINGRDEVAFVATVGRGRVRHGLFLAAPTRLAPRRFRIRKVGRKGLGRIQLALRLRLGRVSDGVTPHDEGLGLWVADAQGIVWSTTVAAGRLDRQGDVYALKAKRKDPLRKQVRRLRVKVSKGGRIDLASTSAATDLTAGGTRELQLPLTVGLQIGDDSGTTALSCHVGKRTIRCGL
jgi:hypothetical protein